MKDRYVSDHAEEYRVFLQCEGIQSIAEIGSQDIIYKLHEKKIIALYHKQIKMHSGQTVLILSPHIDDSVLSLGGIIGRGHNHYHVFNLFHKTNFQSGLRVPEHILDSMGREEDCIAGKCLGFHSHFADCFSAIERYHVSAKKILQKRFYEIQTEDKYREDINTVKNLIFNKLKSLSAEFILSPLGLGGHVDHLIVACATYELVQDNSINKKKIAYYEDLPYAYAFPWYISKGDTPHVFGLQRPKAIDVTDGIARKSEILNIYLTRVRKDQINACILYANSIGKHGGKYSERLWFYDEKETSITW